MRRKPATLAKPQPCLPDLSEPIVSLSTAKQPVLEPSAGKPTIVVIPISMFGRLLRQKLARRKAPTATTGSFWAGYWMKPWLAARASPHLLVGLDGFRWLGHPRGRQTSSSFSGCSSLVGELALAGVVVVFGFVNAAAVGSTTPTWNRILLPWSKYEYLVSNVSSSIRVASRDAATAKTSTGLAIRLVVRVPAETLSASPV